MALEVSSNNNHCKPRRTYHVRTLEYTATGQEAKPKGVSTDKKVTGQCTTPEAKLEQRFLRSSTRVASAH
jgi:hypothetical protein